MSLISVSAERILKYLSLLSIFLVLDGLAYNILFYEEFNIDITGYIDISESLTMFIPIVKEILVASWPLILAYVFIVRLFDKYNTNRAEKNPMHKTWGMIIFSNLFVFVGFLVLDLLVKWLWKDSQFFDWRKNMIFPIVYLTLDIYNKFQDSFKYNHTLAKFIIVNVLIFIFNLVLLVNENVKNIKESKSPCGVTITIKDRPTIKTDSTLVFVGQSKTYLYLFNVPKKTSNIIPKSEILQIDIVAPKN